jgi:hypothetical protein
MIGLGFPHNRRPFSSVQSNHLHISTPTFLKSNSTYSILLSQRLPSYSPSSCFAFQQIFTVLSRPVVTTCPRKTLCHSMPMQDPLSQHAQARPIVTTCPRKTRCHNMPTQDPLSQHAHARPIVTTCPRKTRCHNMPTQDPLSQHAHARPIVTTCPCKTHCERKR